LYLGHAGNEADHQQEGHRRRVHRDEVAHPDDDGGSAEQLLVGEAELHAEEQGEVDGHARQSGVEEHQQVFDHEVRGAADCIQCAQVHAACKLHAEHRDDVYPGLYVLGHPSSEHGHHKAHACGWGRGKW